MSGPDPDVAELVGAAAGPATASGLKGAARGSRVCEGVRSRRLELTGEKVRPAGPVRPRSGLLIQPGKEDEAHGSSTAEASALGSTAGATPPNAAPPSVLSSTQSSDSAGGGCGLSGTGALTSGRTSRGGALTQGEESNEGGRSA